MSEQAKILAQLQELIMEILKSGEASPQQGALLDSLEEQLFAQKCFQEPSNEAYDNLGEEIAYLFFHDKADKAVAKMKEQEISVEDFLGFVEYHFEDDEPVEMFNAAFVDEVKRKLAA